MSGATCLVTAVDHRRYFGDEPPDAPLAIASWSGEERRKGPADRRSGEHDRRWEPCIGRRFGIFDRRRSKA